MPSQNKQSNKCKPQKYEEYEKKVLAAGGEKRAHPELPWEYLHRKSGIAVNSGKNRFNGFTHAQRFAHATQQQFLDPSKMLW